MKIKIYIVTYKNAIDLNDTLGSLFNSDVEKFDYEVNIINNNSEFSLDLEKYKVMVLPVEYRSVSESSTDLRSEVNVLHNVLRPDFSTGHLSRNWNQALVNGFQNLNSPDCDILVHCQDDTSFHEECFSRLAENHNKYSFITSGDGDNLCSYTVDAVKKIGIWDERFSGITHQEADYFLRALKHNREGSTINDFKHYRTLNPVENGYFAKRPHGNATEWRKESGKLINSEMILLQKYRYRDFKIYDEFKSIKRSVSSLIVGWTDEMMGEPPEYSGKLKTSFTYPYFEKDIEDTKDKNYDNSNHDFNGMMEKYYDIDIP